MDDEEWLNFDLRMRAGDYTGFGDEQARSLIEVFHHATGLVVDGGLNEDQSGSTIAQAYTESVAKYQTKL